MNEDVTDHQHITGGIEEDRPALDAHLGNDHGVDPRTLVDGAEWHRSAHRADPLREALRIHHPIMRSETGPFSGCRCGAVKLGQDVIAHVVTELRRALDGDR